MIFVLTLAIGCDEQNEQSDSGNQDTTQAPVTEQIDHQPNDQPSDPVQSVSTGPKNFGELVELFGADLVTDEYKEIAMDPLDQLPKFNEANESHFRRYQVRKPVTLKKGMKTYPRFILKCYRFASEKAADRAATRWLNDFETSADSIALGDPVDAVKSPPLFCSLREEGFFILQTACIYQHPTQDSLKERFFTWMEDNGARMGWEIGCDAGRLSYRFQNDL